MLVRLTALVLGLSCLSAGRAFADGGFSLGLEASSLFSQEMQIYQAPTITRTRTDLVTGLSTIRSVPYFSQVDPHNDTTIDPVQPTTSTFIRNWQNMDVSGAYTFMKGSYSNQWFDFTAKLGAANRILRARQHQIEQDDTQGHSSTVNDETTFMSLAELPQGFAYALEIKGQPYDGDNFQVMAGIHLSQYINKATMFDDAQVIRSTDNVTQTLKHVQQKVDYDEIDYGFSIVGALKTEHFSPYAGILYNDGRYKVTNTNLTTTQTFDRNGNQLSGSEILDTISYTLTPKLQPLVIFHAKASLIVGFNIPFENGGISVEGKYAGQSSLTISGHVGF